MQLLFLFRTDDDALGIYRVHGESAIKISDILPSEFSMLSIEECYMRAGSVIIEELRSQGLQLELPTQPPPSSPPLSAANVAHYLLQRSVAEKSASYVSAIDELLQKGEDDELAALSAAWPVIRARLQTFSSSN